MDNSGKVAGTFDGTLTSGQIIDLGRVGIKSGSYTVEVSSNKTTLQSFRANVKPAQKKSTQPIEEEIVVIDLDSIDQKISEGNENNLNDLESNAVTLGKVGSIPGQSMESSEFVGKIENETNVGNLIENEFQTLGEAQAEVFNQEAPFKNDLQDTVESLGSYSEDSTISTSTNFEDISNALDNSDNQDSQVKNQSVVLPSLPGQTLSDTDKSNANNNLRVEDSFDNKDSGPSNQGFASVPLASSADNKQSLNEKIEENPKIVQGFQNLAQNVSKGMQSLAQNLGFAPENKSNQNNQAEQANQIEQANQAEQNNQVEQNNQANQAEQAEQNNQTNQTNQAQQVNQTNQAQQAEQTEQANQANQTNQAEQANQTEQAEQVSNNAQAAVGQTDGPKVLVYQKLLEDVSSGIFYDDGGKVFYAQPGTKAYESAIDNLTKRANDSKNPIYDENGNVVEPSVVVSQIAEISKRNSQNVSQIGDQALELSQGASQKITQDTMRGLTEGAQDATQRLMQSALQNANTDPSQNSNQSTLQADTEENSRSNIAQEFLQDATSIDNKSTDRTIENNDQQQVLSDNSQIEKTSGALTPDQKTQIRRDRVNLSSVLSGENNSQFISPDATQTESEQLDSQYESIPGRNLPNAGIFEAFVQPGEPDSGQKEISALQQIGLPQPSQASVLDPDYETVPKLLINKQSARLSNLNEDNAQQSSRVNLNSAFRPRDVETPNQITSEDSAANVQDLTAQPTYQTIEQQPRNFSPAITGFKATDNPEDEEDEESIKLKSVKYITVGGDTLMKTEVPKDQSIDSTTTQQIKEALNTESIIYQELLKERERFRANLETERGNNRANLRRAEQQIQQELVKVITEQPLEAEGENSSPINQIIQSIIKEDREVALERETESIQNTIQNVQERQQEANKVAQKETLEAIKTSQEKAPEKVFIDATKIIQMIQEKQKENESAKEIDEFLLRQRIERELKYEFNQMQIDHEKKLRMVYRKMIEQMYLDMLNS